MRGRATRAIAIVSIAAATLALAAPAGAYHRDRQQELEDLIDGKRDQISALSSKEQGLLQKLNESTARRNDLEARLGSIVAELRVARSQLRSIERRLDRTAAEVRALDAEIEVTRGELDERTDILDARVAEIFTSAPEAYTAVFQYAESLEDAIAGSEYVERVVEFDRELLDGIESTKIELEIRYETVEAKRNGLRRDRQAARATATDIAAKRNARREAVNKIAREVNYQNYVLGQIRSKKAQSRRILKEYERESQEISEFLRGAQGGQQVIQGRGGWLRWPVSGSITSPYGWRTHPITGQRSFHTGIDIGASQGTTVRSARIGEVIDVGYRGAYGLVVIVDHGSSVATIYAHLSAAYVRVGEHVSTLESVGAVGSTGWSTGPHLHFEVRANGYHSNPGSWM